MKMHSAAASMSLGLITNGRGEPVDDAAIIFADDVYEIEVRGEGADELAADIVRACTAHDDLVKALGGILPLAEAWADGKGRSHPDHEWIEFALDALAKAEAA